MATTTISAICARVEAVLQDEPFSFTAAPDVFSHDEVPNATVASRYRVVHEGTTSSLPVGNKQYVRIDRVTVYLGQKLAFAPHGSVQGLDDTLDDVENYVKADGPDHGYRAWARDRRISRSDRTKDVVIGSITFEMDYDYDGSIP